MKQPILGQDFLAENILVEKSDGRFLTQIQTDLFIPAVNNTTWWAGHVNQVQIDQRVRKILNNFPQVTKVSSSSYSKLVIETGDLCQARFVRGRCLGRSVPRLNMSSEQWSRIVRNCQPQLWKSMGGAAAHGEEVWPH